MMDPVAKEAWMTALRSGEYKQTRGQLCDHEGKMCCLGVLYDVAVDGDWDVEDNNEGIDPDLVDGDSWDWGIKIDKDAKYIQTTDLTDEILTQLGLTEDDQIYLVSMNDLQRKRFPTIANWVEANL